MLAFNGGHSSKSSPVAVRKDTGALGTGVTGADHLVDKPSGLGGVCHLASQRVGYGLSKEAKRKATTRSRRLRAGALYIQASTCTLCLVVSSLSTVQTLLVTITVVYKHPQTLTYIHAQVASESPEVFPFSSIVHHLSGPNTHVRTQNHSRDHGHCDCKLNTQTGTHARLLLPCIKTGRTRPCSQKRTQAVEQQECTYTAQVR